MRLGQDVTGIPRKNNRALAAYFEYANQGIEVVEDGLKEMCFGEYLVERGIIDRFQLLQALQMQDRQPGVLLGECVAALGRVPYSQIERHLASFNNVDVVDLD